MIRGTTAQFKFKLPYNENEISIVKVMFWQTGNDGPDITRPLPIIKVKEQCSFPGGGNELFVSLNKEETLRFEDDRKAYVQLQAKTIDGTSFACKQETITVYPVYDESIFDEEVIPTPSPETSGIIILDGSTIDTW
jgi:hypothetical protein